MKQSFSMKESDSWETGNKRGEPYSNPAYYFEKVPRT